MKRNTLQSDNYQVFGNKTLSSNTDIADKIRQVYERNQHEVAQNMNLQKDWAPAIGLVFIVVGLLWLSMRDSSGFVFGVSFIVIGACTILMNYLLPKNKQ
ncbi:hypothetical protein [Lacticaseibacillus jixiensis]|uniref:hypothetical protein n=1 Tax=Lacticaseibacillus jixiensis TaxID=3231926 RepID=UPI0036F272F6